MRQPSAAGYSIFQTILAAGSVAAITAILFALREYLTTPIIALLYLLPVLLSTTQWGLGAGITASVCSFLAFNFFFILPYYTLVVHQSQDVIVLFVFLIVAIVISQLVGRVRSSLASAEAREREVIYLYELSADLAGLRHPEEVGRMLAKKIHEILEPACIQVYLQLTADSQPMALQMPNGTPPPRRPDRVIPLAANRGSLGEIRFWEGDRSVSRAESHLLLALAGQGALALERAALAEAETRAAILEESDRLKSALLSSVSHELRTPLVTIKAAATSLRSGTVAWESEARGDLLNMSRIEAGALKLQRQWNILAEIVDTVAASLRAALAGHRLEVNVPDNLPLVPVDAVLLHQVLANLLSNCLKYAPVGTAIGITARVQEEGGEILVQITNEGPPVPEEHLEHIFDKFHRVTAADRVPGTGLGLSICRGIIETHGGRIRAENLPRGFAFKFTLPLTWEGTVSPRMPADPEHT